VRTGGRTDGQTESWTDMTKLIVAFRSFAIAPHNQFDNSVICSLKCVSYPFEKCKYCAICTQFQLDFCLTVHHPLGKEIHMNQLDATMIY